MNNILLYWDLDTNNLVRTPGQVSGISRVDWKRGDTVSPTVAFCRGATPCNPPGTTAAALDACGIRFSARLPGPAGPGIARFSLTLFASAYPTTAILPPSTTWTLPDSSTFDAGPCDWGISLGASGGTITATHEDIIAAIAAATWDPPEGGTGLPIPITAAIIDDAAAITAMALTYMAGAEPPPAVMGAKRHGNYRGDASLLLDGPAVLVTADAVFAYLFVGTTNTSPIDTDLLNSPGDPLGWADYELEVELRLPDDSLVLSSGTVKLRIHHDIIRGDEVEPELLP